MRVTIVVEDNIVVIEGAAEEVDCAALLEQNVHALQWFGEFGEIEFSTDAQTGHREPNLKITDISLYQMFIDAWMANAQKPKIGKPPEPWVLRQQEERRKQEEAS